MELSPITLYRLDRRTNVRVNKTEVRDLARDARDILLQ